jgi:hypothetical protein
MKKRKRHVQKKKPARLKKKNKGYKKNKPTKLFGGKSELKTNPTNKKRERKKEEEDKSKSSTPDPTKKMYVLTCFINLGNVINVISYNFSYLSLKFLYFMMR